jgi:transposase
MNISNFELINPNAAGIDIGSGEHWVCVPADRIQDNVRRFGCYTPDLIAVAMEATGVYWIPIFQILEAKGIEVRLVNAHHVKTVPGRKSDVLDCQWLQKLHTFGLLSGSFRPDDQVCVLRSYIRQRETLIKGAATHVQRMQKALIQLNHYALKVHRFLKG